jgi:phosphoglucan,water dikinase
VAENAVKVFAEANIRSHLVFQVSKLADQLVRHTREWLAMSSWDVLVPGEALGRVITLSAINELPATDKGPWVILLKRADGDEELPKNVAGIVLAHEMPHLAHLSVRARQAGVVFGTCEDQNEFARLQSLENQSISLVALSDGVRWQKREDPGEAGTLRPAVRVRIPEAQLDGARSWIQLEEANIGNAGAKADGARRLAALAGQSKAGFKTPVSIVIPLGAMEAAFAGSPALRTEYKNRIRVLDKLESTKFATAVEELREIVGQLTVPDVIAEEVKRRFLPESALIVRSSANCEDLENFAGAGLYDSVINVRPDEVAAAIRSVWASLWTLRAAESRRAAGINHEQAHMAVLIQELFNPDFSFILHTTNPITRDFRELYAEIVPGLGETLASAANAGSPYRMICDKQSGSVRVLAFANFSRGLQASYASGIHRATLDYSKIEFSREPESLEKCGRQLSTIGSCVEQDFGAAQDIEGVLVKDGFYLVQARPQQGLAVLKTA